jgi:prepilin-type N-terminal cleavage/methylation domain-containing protein/prepilin-type processing-associated H-X9-DG protein
VNACRGIEVQCFGDRNRRPAAAFTLIELLVVVAIIAILASLLLPALAHAKDQGRRAVCISNFRQLHIAWHLYADDNGDYLPWNSFSQGKGEIPNTFNWVGGFLQRLDDWPDNTNTFKIVKAYGGIGCYLNDVKVYKCPSDFSVAKISGRIHPRVRSVTMSEFMDGTKGYDPNGLASYYYQTLADIAAHPPVENGSVFIDTHEDTIASGCFPIATPFKPWWAGFPGNRHGGATISFTDGHVICHRWLDQRTRISVTGAQTTPSAQPGNRDIRWVQERATALRPGGTIYPDN